jgi:hypothetical protein
MNEKIRFQENIPADLDRVLENYMTNSGATVNRVRKSISRTFDFIETFPKMYAVIYEDVRLVKTKEYPILIQYRIVENIPVILSLHFAGTPTD